MFLMNAPPVIALQSKWESFGQSGSFRFPVCFSESEEDIARASVSAKVQMIINNLQSEEASLGMNNEYIMQKNQRGGKYKGARIAAANTIVLKEHSTYAKSELSTEFDHMEDDSSEFGPLVLESDSDDSVDREIEQAIQEYLKEKSNSIQSSPSSNASCFGTTVGNNRVKQEDLPQNNVTTHLPPVKCKSDVISEAVICNPKRIHEKPRTSSPLSVSSDDSFEQSIQAEIEQFLNEKKQQEVHKYGIPLDKRTEQKEVLEKAVSKSSKESFVKSNRQDLKQGCKELIFKQYPELGKTNVQPKCFKPRISTESENFTNIRLALPKLAGCHPLETAQNKGVEKKHSWANRREQRIKSAALVYEISDSSSDDGIEEAIQMYQLEKTRKEASSTVDNNLLQKTQPRNDKVSDLAASIAVGSSKSALLESHKKTLNSKRKQTATKATELSNSSCDSNKLFKPLKETKVSTPPMNTIAKCEFTVQPSFQAETSAELMCAEAILDIYKTIMPSHVESNDRSLSTNPLFSSQNVPSHPDSDSSLVDSDDSIEQEIRTFLALKAQSEHLLAKPENLSKSVQGPLLPEHSNQGSSPKVPLSKTLKLSLCCKRKLKGERKVVKQLTPKKTKGLERECPQETEYGQVKIHMFQEKKDLSSQDKICNSESREDEMTCQFLSSNLVGLIDEHIALDLRSGLSQAHGKVAQGRNLEQERPGSGDKSSSLDSDEDLDTAIKDLLRSKRKLKKRCRDSKPHCKKKVKLSSTGTQFLDKFNKLQKHWKDKSPHLLKSCLPGSKKDNRENTVKKSLNTCNNRTERGKQEKKQEDLQLAFQLEKKIFSKPILVSNDMEISENRNSAISTISLSDDSSSVDSDDSIEQEIRKFLAEKAKYSMSSSEIKQGSITTALDIGGVSKPEIVSGKEKHPSVGHLPGLLSSQSQKNKIVSQKAEDLKISDKTVIQSAINILNDGRKSTSCPGNIYLHSTLAVKTKHETVTPKSCCGSLSVKETPVDKKDVCIKDQSQKSLEPTDTENVASRLQNYYITDNTTPEKSSPFQGKCCCKSTRDQKCVPESERNLLLNNRHYALQSDFVHEGVFQNICVLHTGGKETMQKGNHRKEREKRLKDQTKSSAKYTIDHQQSLHLAGFHSLIPTGVFNFGKSTSQGSKQTSLLDSNQAVPLQVPLFTSLKENKLSKDSGIFGSSYLLLKKEGSDWQSRKTRAELNIHEVKKFSSGGKMLNLRNRRIVDKDAQDQKVLENDSSEFNGTSIEESRNSVGKGKILNL
ncbi:protein phosphatase 1 regulatory subunit 26 [Dromiciops gliroides]|uniref:protein phosphatase 1 regulatory subunit 26 n=1 Tax=Dromiciops gliroides TaxID=33562 RepID=UPI001CC72FCE|nr:protein phosphatase 1 regulatory subunit 26 [Dromiciops gliroides]XP_043843242.1 protein phosphatase 1 regulatory subunit 26 [Dromiciops gliroides]